MIVIPFLLALTGSSYLIKGQREQGISWKNTILTGLALGTVISIMNASPHRQECSGGDPFTAGDCEYVKQEPTPFHESFISYTLIGLTAAKLRSRYEDRF